MKDLEIAILDTVAYFDVFDYPMTKFEIWQYLYFSQGNGHEVAYQEISELLDGSVVLSERINFQYGYYFLVDREDIIKSRRQRYAYAEKKYMKAIRVIKWLRFFPFVKMIAVCNTLAFNNSRREADIDLFIITKPGHIWQTRFWVNSFLKFFKIRPSQERSQDTICSTFFLDESHLDLEESQIDQSDIYLKYWVRQLIPIYDEGVYDNFFRTNDWVKKFIPNALAKALPARRRINQLHFSKIIINSIAFILPEKLFKKYQMKIMPAKLQEMANQDTRVVVNDHMLKFHDNDRRHKFLEKWQAKRQQIL